MRELGTSVRHMGPMAQDWNTALAPLNLGHRAENGSVPDQLHSCILTSHTDGVLMSAARGMTREINSQQAVIGGFGGGGRDVDDEAASQQRTYSAQCCFYLP